MVARPSPATAAAAAVPTAPPTATGWREQYLSSKVATAEVLPYQGDAVGAPGASITSHLRPYPYL